MVLLSVLSFLDLARLVEEASASGEEVHLQGSWPMTAMIWTASNLEAQGRLFDVPLPVVVQLRMAQSVPVGSGSLLPQVVTHPSTPCPGGVYRQDLGSFGESSTISFVCFVFLVFLRGGFVGSHHLFWFLFSYFVFLDSTPGSAGLMDSGAVSDVVGGDVDVTVHHIISSDESQVTPQESFLMNGSFEEKARRAHATSSPELTPTGVPYPSIEGQTMTPVGADGYPCPVAGALPLRDSLGRPVRPLSTLTEAGLRLQSMSAWCLFKKMESPSVREERLSVAVEEYNQEFQAVSDALDYEPLGPGDDSDVSEIPLRRLTVQGIISLFVALAVVLSFLSLFRSW